MSEKRSTGKRLAFAWAVFVLVVGLGAAAMVASAGPLYRDKAITLTAAFDLMRKGAWIGLGAAGGGLVGSIGSLLVRRPAAVVMTLLALAVGATVFGWPYASYRKTKTLPPIHDIATNPEAPLRFTALKAIRRASPDGLDYGGGGTQVAQAERQAIAEFLNSKSGRRNPGYRRVASACQSWSASCLAAIQRAYYPGIRPLPIPGANPGRVFSVALGLVHDLGWDVAAANPATGHIEATAATSWFGLKQDVVIEISSGNPGSVVDMRSESRIEISDGGENAGRVRRFLDRLAHRVPRSHG